MNNILAFPIYKVPIKSKVVLYGAGKNGLKIWELNKIQSIYDIVAVIDERFEEKNDFPQVVYSVDALEGIIEFEYVIISIDNDDARNEVYNRLLSKGIGEEKIVDIRDFRVYVPNKIEPINLNVERKGKIRVGMLSLFGGLGDQVITLSVFDAIRKELPEAEIDIFTFNRVFSDSIFYGQKSINRIIAVRDKKLVDYLKYDLFLELSFELLVKAINKNRICMVNPDFMQRLQFHIEKQLIFYVDNMYTTYSDRILWDRAKFKNLDRYSLYCEHNCLRQIDKYVNININSSYRDEFQNLKLKNRYITFSFGANGVTKGSKLQTKMWIKEYYEELFGLIKKKYPHIEIIQLGDENANKVFEVDRYILGRNLEVVKYILKNALFHLDCEGGLVHLATHLGTKCIVLFGPTPIDFYGYDRNINIKSDVCGECFGLIKDYQYVCSLYEEPKCMKTITVKKVYEEMVEYIDNSIVAYF